MPRCVGCAVVNDDANHFCVHCGGAFLCECAVCYRLTASYARCGHPLCVLCRRRLPRAECPVCAAPLLEGTSVAELTQLIRDLRLFRCDLVLTLAYRLKERRFGLFDARHLVGPILESPLWMRRARALVTGWDGLVELARADAGPGGADTAVLLASRLRAL
jgi:hypothetical protein